MGQRVISILLLMVFLFTPFGPARAQTDQPVLAAVGQPTLKWANKGCFRSWCETGWYSSPAVVDLDGDGQVEVLGAAYSIVSINGDTGELAWRVYSGHDRSYTGTSNVGRTWPGIVATDLDGDGGLEIVTAHSGGWVAVYDSQGMFKPGWPKKIAPDDQEFRSLGAYDLEGDGTLEILTASTAPANQWSVHEPDGTLRPGVWPQHSFDSDTNGWTHGGYNQNLAAGDLDGDGRAEIVGPNDTHYIAAFKDDGSQLRASTLYGKRADGGGKFWSQVGVHVDHAVDLRGYAHCGTDHRPNFASSAPLIVDVNGDGVLEVVVIGNVYNCATSPYTDLYEIPFVLNGDRTRWKAGEFDWTVVPEPAPGSAPLSQDYRVIENNQPNPAAADLDGDGYLEILYPSYDGRMHVYWLDRTEHGDWPYSVTKPGEALIRFASEPLVVDLDGNGQAEVLFTSWVPIGSRRTGKLHILSTMGQPIWEVDLPPAFDGSDWNGAMAAPTLANIDADADLEIVINTAHSGLVAYDLPGSANARVLWGTGRGNFQRSGSVLRGSLAGSSKVASNPVAGAGQAVTYQITLRNSGPVLTGVTVTDPLPEGITYWGDLEASSGTAAFASNTVSWVGDVYAGVPVRITYQTRVDEVLISPKIVINNALVDDGQEKLSLQASVFAGSLARFLPLLMRYP
jgi:uncharacterized repeat protein (TIGR01451 family)